MCTRKIEINVKKPDDITNKWKYPKTLLEQWEEGIRPQMFVKCGQCYECKMERGRNWIYKIWLEALEHREKCFITLTYKDNQEGTRQVSKKNLQNFIKRLRKNTGAKFKYFAAGEYGERKGRPHYHIIILGWQPKDIKKTRRRSKKGFPMYSSKLITETWGKGLTTIQEFNYREIGYLTLYINHNQKINKYINKEEIKQKKIAQAMIEQKVGISEIIELENGKIKTNKLKQIKELNKEESQEYKKLYNKHVLNIEMKKQNEFNLYSKGMGFESYIKRKYYKYELNIEGYNYERPKDYLRKIIENKNEYNNEIIEQTIYELLERKEYAEGQMKELEEMTNEDIRSIERTQIEKNKNKIREKKHIKSDF